MPWRLAGWLPGLEVEGREVGIELVAGLAAGVEAFVGRKLGRGAAKVEGHAVEELAVVGDVRLLQGVVVDGAELLEDVVNALRGIAGDVVVSFERGLMPRSPEMSLPPLLNTRPVIWMFVAPLMPL